MQLTRVPCVLAAAYYAGASGRVAGCKQDKAANMQAVRCELKYMISHRLRDKLLGRWGRYLVRAPFTNQHAVSPVLSQYYDSPDFDFYWDKIDGVSLRYKVRIRTYGYRFCPGQCVFLEIKQRENTPVRKYRQRIGEFRPEHLLPCNWQLNGSPDTGRFGSLLERYRLRPSAQVFYLREAYQGIGGQDVRITFDTCVVALHPGEQVTRPLLEDPARRLLPDTLTILEIKLAGSMPRWVSEIIVGNELQHRRIPKYTTAVEKLGLLEMNPTGVYA